MKKVVSIITCLAALSVSESLVSYEHDFFTSDIYRNFEEKIEDYRMKPVTGRNIKIQELIEIGGEEAVKIIGFGVVSGLNGTGDSTPAAIKMLREVAEKQGIRISQDDLKEKNVALVSLSAEVGPHDRTFDVAVKSIGDAKSLQYGFLEASTLNPVGSETVFAIASGSLALGARFFEAGPAGGAVGGATSVTVGNPTTAFVIDGGQMIRELPSHRIEDGTVKLYLKHPNDRTATNISNVINAFMQDLGIRAEPTSGSLITVFLPRERFENNGKLTRLIADIGELPTTISRKAKITIDQSSGVIAMTEGVKMEPGSIAVAGLTVTVSSDITPVTRQGFNDGETAFFDSPELEVAEEQANFLMLPAGTDLRKVQETLNALRLKPTSIISVFNAMHKAGMIHADIVVLPR